MADEEQSSPGIESGEHDKPGDMAKAWLGRKLMGINNEKEALEHGYEFAKGYEPTPPGPRPHPEDGGMDLADWEAEMLEYVQWPEEQIEILDSYPDRIMDLEAKAHEMKAHLDKIAEGDTELIKHYASLEQERITIAKERSGLEYEGSVEVHNKLLEIFQIVGFSHEYKGYKLLGKKGSSGWRVAIQGSIGGYSQYLYFNHEHGNGEDYSSQIRLSKGGSWEHEQREVSVSFSDKVKKPQTEYGGGEDDGGIFFMIKDGVVRLQSVDSKSGKRRFTQEDFNNFKTVFKNLYSDLKELNSQLSSD